MEVGRGRRPGDPLGARFLDSPLPPPHYIVIIIIITIVIVIVIVTITMVTSHLKPPWGHVFCTSPAFIHYIIIIIIIFFWVFPKKEEPTQSTQNRS